MLLAGLTMALLICLTSSTETHNLKNTMFREDLVIFSSNYNITKILVPAEGMSYAQKDYNDIPTIFFTISDRNLDGGTCIYVLKGLAAYEVLEGGRDTTCDYGSDRSIYFGAKDGVYKYDSDSLSAKRHSTFRDDVIQIQKANGTDVIYYLTAQKGMYKLEKKGTVRTEVKVPCALEFVLDNKNNIYYIDCIELKPFTFASNGTVIEYKSFLEPFKEVKLIRPAFIMDRCVPFFGDGDLYFLYSNGTSVKMDVYVPDNPVYSVDAGLYLAAALNGKIYEFNVMDFFLKSMFGLKSNWPNGLIKIVMSLVESMKDDVHRANKH